MSNFVIGAGEIGRRLVNQLTSSGAEVTVASRSGTAIPGAKAVSLDATDSSQLKSAIGDHEVVFLVSSPTKYHRWNREWPPMIESVIRAAAGRRLVLMGNLYAYGRVSVPMTESHPLEPADPNGVVRRDIWLRALQSHQVGDLQAVEVRASDYFGPGVGRTAALGDRFFVPLLSGGKARVIGNLGAPHSWTYLTDIVTTLIAAADHRGEWGRAWHVPASTDRSYSEIVGDMAELGPVPGHLAAVSDRMLAGLSALSPTMRAVRQRSYQFESPFIVDATETARLLGVSATPWDQALSTTVASYRD